MVVLLQKCANSKILVTTQIYGSDVCFTAKIMFIHTPLPKQEIKNENYYKNRCTAEGFIVQKKGKGLIKRDKTQNAFSKDGWRDFEI